MIRVRLATAADLPALRELIPRSVRELSRDYYSPVQIESALRYVFGPDTTLIADGTYFIAETADGALAGCGGWSKRQTLFGGDQMKSAHPHATGDALLDPAVEAARIRAFYVAPGHARSGVGSGILRACVDAAHAAGFTRLELGATLPGVPFYLAHGFVRDRPLDTVLPDGTEIAFVQMSAKVAALTPDRPRPDVSSA